MLRLWNMLDARCIFKKRVGIPEDDDDSRAGEDELPSDEEASEPDIRQTLNQKFQNTPELVKWEPTQG